MKKIISILVAGALFIASAFPSVAQNNFPTASGAPNSQVQGIVTMCINASGVAVPIDAAGLNCGGDSGGNGPPGSVQATGIFSGADTTTAAASLGATAGKTNYLCNVNVSGLGTSGASIVNVLVTITGLVGGNTLTYSYSFPVGATVGSTPLQLFFSPCIAASAVNSAITVTVPGAAGNTATQINLTGFRQ